MLGGWTHVPTGCMLTKTGGHAWRTWFNVNPTGKGAGGWYPICEDEGEYPQVNATLADYPAPNSSVLVAVVDLGESGCNTTHPCPVCQGDCDNDNDCAGGLACFQRHYSNILTSAMVPGCAATGYVTSTKPHDYCYDPNPVDSGCNPASSVPVPASRCEQAAYVARPRDAIPFFAISEGSWAHVPKGCTLSRDKSAAYFNKHVSGADNGHFTRLCESKVLIPHVCASITSSMTLSSKKG